jgi:CHAT domain-containing protein
MGSGGDGSEVEGFGMLAQEKGALAVLASLWAVADESTAKLMREFYRIRVTKPALTKAEALRQAQLALLRGEVKAGAASKRSRSEFAGEIKGGKFPEYKADAERPYAHPYYWAPFILIGNWR